MMPLARPAHPTRHVVAALTADFVHGRLAPGRPLQILALSERFALSPTPVREALARLTGAGWLEAAPGGGYVCAPLDAPRLEGLRRLERLFLEAALEHVARPVESARTRLERRLAADPSLAAATHWLFGEVVELTRGAVLADAFERVSVRLGAARRAEAVNGREELVTLAAALETSLGAARLEVAQYFARRSGRERWTCEEVAALGHAEDDPR